MPFYGGNADLEAIIVELNSRNVTSNRLNALLRRVDTESGEISTTTGTDTHQDGTTEQTVLQLAGLKSTVAVSLDMINIAQRTIIRVKEQVDGATLRPMFQQIYPDDWPDLKVVEFEIVGKGRTVSISAESIVAEGSNKSIPHTRKEWVS